MTDNEINEAVARKLGYDIRLPHHAENPFLVRRVEPGDHSISDEEIPDYCHSIEAAWEIVVSLMPRYTLCLEGDQEWSADFYTVNEEEDVIARCEASADTAPMAICKAFLKL